MEIRKSQKLEKAPQIPKEIKPGKKTSSLLEREVEMSASEKKSHRKKENFGESLEIQQEALKEARRKNSELNKKFNGLVERYHNASLQLVRRGTIEATDDQRARLGELTNKIHNRMESIIECSGSFLKIYLLNTDMLPEILQKWNDLSEELDKLTEAYCALVPEILATRKLEAVEGPVSMVREYGKKFSSLLEQSTDLLRTHDATRKALSEKVILDKIELTADQKAAAAMIDKKIALSIKRMEIVSQRVKEALKMKQTDALERLCLETSEYVVNALDQSAKEYTALMIRIFSEDADLEAQLAELVLSDFEEILVEEPKGREAKVVEGAALPSAISTGGTVDTEPEAWSKAVTNKLMFLLYGSMK